MTRPPAGFRYVDVHTHLHPERLVRAIRRWFAERSDWKLEQPTEPDRVADFLRERDVERFVFFSYAHKAGLARELNAWLHAAAARLPGGLALGTVHPDDPDMLDVADQALGEYGLQPAVSVRSGARRALGARSAHACVREDLPRQCHSSLWTLAGACESHRARRTDCRRGGHPPVLPSRLGGDGGAR